MSEDSTDTLVEDLVEKNEKRTEQPASSTNAPPKTSPQQNLTNERLKRSFASQYLDELILAILFHSEEANGMDVIRELAHVFGVQFSPGTVYPHLHSLREDGVLTRRECIQTKEYRIQDEKAAQQYIESTLVQLSQLASYLDTAHSSREPPEDSN